MRVGTRTTRRGRALVLLVAYALFMALPGLHLVLHDHGGPIPAPASSGIAYLDHACSGCCGDEGEHPLHDGCAVCDVIHSFNATPGEPSQGPRAAPVVLALAVSYAPLPDCGVCAPPTARGPPVPFAS